MMESKKRDNWKKIESEHDDDEHFPEFVSEQGNRNIRTEDTETTVAHTLWSNL